MPHFREIVDVDATPKEVWAVLGDLAAVDRWLPGVTKVEVDGVTRICTFEDGHVQHEQISEYSPEERSFRYRIEGGLPVTENRGRFSVEDRAEGSRVVWESSWEPLDPGSEPQLTEMWRAALPAVLGNLKLLVEHDGSA